MTDCVAWHHHVEAWLLRNLLETNSFLYYCVWFDLYTCKQSALSAASKGLTTIAKLPSGWADQDKGVEEGHLYAGRGLNGQFEGGTGIIVITLASDNRPNTLHSILKIISLSRCKRKLHGRIIPKKMCQVLMIQIFHKIHKTICYQ